MSSLVYKDVIPSVGGNQFFYARILGCSHVGGVWGGTNKDVVSDVMTSDRQKYSTYAWEEVTPNQIGGKVVWARGNRSSYSFYEVSHDPIEPGETEDVDVDGETEQQWVEGTEPEGPQTGLYADINTLNDYFVENNIKNKHGNMPDSKYRDRSLYREYIDEGVDRINDLSSEYDPSGAPGTDEGPNAICVGCPDDPNYAMDYFGSPEGGSDWWADGMDPNDPETLPGNTGGQKKILFGGVHALNVSEYNRYHNPASSVGSVVLMQEVADVGGSPKYYFDAPETRGAVLAKIIRAHPIGPMMPNVDPDEDPEFRMWAYEWREVEFNMMPDLSKEVVAKQHKTVDDARELDPVNRDRDVAVVGADYPIRDGGDYRVGGKTLSAHPPISVGGYTANADIEHWVSTRLGTADVDNFDQPVFDLVKEKGFFKDTIMKKINKYFGEEAPNPDDPPDNDDPDNDDPDKDIMYEDERRSLFNNEIAVLKSGVFGGEYDKLQNIDLPAGTTGTTGDSSGTTGDVVLTDDDIKSIEEYLTSIDLPRTNPLALNTCEFLNVSTDNQYIDTGIRGETGGRKLVPRYVAPGVDMSKLPRFMRVQPIRPGSIILMSFPSTSFYTEPEIKYPDGTPYSGTPIPLQNRPNQNPPMFTCPNAIDTLDDPCAFKQLPFPFKLENVNEQFINTVQPVQGSYVVGDSTIQPNP